MIELFTWFVASSLSIAGWFISLFASLVMIAIFFPLLILWFWGLVRVLNKMGYSGWWSLLTFIPPLALIALWVMAFSDWPSQRRLITVIPPR